MMSSFARQASRGAAALRRALAWPARVGAARRTMSQLARMSDYELRDIGLTRQDVSDASALPLDADPSALLARRRAARERNAAEPRGLRPPDPPVGPSPSGGKTVYDKVLARFAAPEEPMTAQAAAHPGPAKPAPGRPRSSRDDALAFLADLHRRFDARRLELLARRMERQKLFDAGQLPHFLTETKSVRDGDWKVAPIPADLLDRRVEITGPVDRKMIVNALNSGAKVFMADFEDATSPMWANMIEGQANLKDRWAGTIDFTDPATGKAYALKSNPAVLMVRPRGWHLPERHVTVDGREMSGSLFDFGLYVFHCAKAQMAQGATARFLSAEDGEPSRGAAVERGLLPRRSRARRSARHVQGDGADRDAAGRVRDGRDPLRTARPHRRPQLRPLGLHFLVHQAARQEPARS